MSFETEVLQLTNQFRSENGRSPLKLNAELNATAYGHSKDMAQQDYFSHTGKDGSRPWDRAKRIGYEARAMGENIAAGQSTPQQVVQGWINSPGHRANLLNASYTELGVGYYYQANDTGSVNYNRYWTQMFGSGDTNPSTNLPSPSPSPNPSPSPSPTPSPTPTTPIRYEAEQLQLSGYKIESTSNSGASGGRQISLKDTGKTTGKATGVFNGRAGNYQVKISYFDESDGVSNATVTVDGQSKSFKFDRNLPSAGAERTARAWRTTHAQIALQSGDRFEIAGKLDRGEMARFDYIEFVPVQKQAVNSAFKDETGSQVDSVSPGADSPAGLNGAGLIDLRQSDLNQDGQVDQKVSLTFDTIRSDAAYSNSVGFYVVANENGAIANPDTDELIQPGDAEYASAALKQRLPDVQLQRNTGKLTAEVDGDVLLAPFIVANGTADTFLSENPSNQNNQRNGNAVNAYFAFGSANPGKATHVKTLGGTTLGFEDQGLGSDRDFNDFTFKVETTAA
jgi:hypothetical protein